MTSSLSDHCGRNFKSSICNASLAVLCLCDQKGDLVKHVSQLSPLFHETVKRRNQISEEVGQTRDGGEKGWPIKCLYWS